MLPLVHVRPRSPTVHHLRQIEVTWGYFTVVFLHGLILRRYLVWEKITPSWYSRPIQSKWFQCTLLCQLVTLESLKDTSRHPENGAFCFLWFWIWWLCCVIFCIFAWVCKAKWIESRGWYDRVWQIILELPVKCASKVSLRYLGLLHRFMSC